MNFFQAVKNGLIDENPTFNQVLGMCPTLAVTTSAVNGLGMGLATTAVLILSNFVISLLRKVIPAKIRIPAFVVIIASFVTIIGLLLKAYVPALDKSLGLFIPLIVVNCIILGRAEAYACNHNVKDSAKDGLMMGLSYTLSLLVMSLIRQVLGTGVLELTNPFAGSAVIFSIRLIPEQFIIPMFTGETGAFFTFAVLAALIALYKNKLAEAEAAAEKAAKVAAAKAKAAQLA